jgi:DNA-binding PadR family transcriptional regulator
MLAVEPRSGYDIKALVDQTTRFFWAASYGQIYPELKGLDERGLIEAEADPQGGRRRTTYRITAAGREALAAWIREPEQVQEMRDEGLLKLFFAGVLGREECIAVVEAKREFHVRKLDALREIEPVAKANERPGPYAALRYGLGMAEFAIDWCDEILNELKEKR